ncbi:MAG: hypothetical protein IJ072_06745, partial [Oscillospiraceae bacterium]|nr:hypothetical protein [Oscillospiraceae bacterium]
MKRIISVLLVLTLAFALTSTALATSVKPIYSDTVVQAGEDLTVKVVLDETLPMVYNLEYFLKYNRGVFTFKNGETGDSTELFVVNPDPNLADFGIQEEGDYVAFLFASETGEPVQVPAGTLYKLIFTANEDITQEQAAEFRLLYTCGSDEKFEDIDIDVIDETVVITVTPKPAVEITKQPESVTVPAGGTASFGVEAAGDDLSYQWQFSKNGGSTWSNVGASIVSSKTANLSFTAKDSYNGFQYRCVVTDGSGISVASEGATLSIGQPAQALAITKQPESVTVPAGGTASFGVEATGDDLSYQWQFSKNG